MLLRILLTSSSLSYINIEKNHFVRPHLQQFVSLVNVTIYGFTLIDLQEIGDSSKNLLPPSVHINHLINFENLKVLMSSLNIVLVVFFNLLSFNMNCERINHELKEHL